MSRRVIGLVALIALALLILGGIIVIPRLFPERAEEPVDVVAFLANPSREDLPEPIALDEAVAQILALHAANDGSTFNMYFGDLGGQALYAVSLYPDLGIVLDGKDIPEDVLRRFIEDNRALLEDPRVSVGTWYDSEGGKTYLDLSATLADREQAIELGRQYNQIAIFDLATFEEIETGGTGESVENLPPPGERLPPLDL